MDTLAVIEMPQNSYLKYEFSKTTGMLTIDRVLNQPVPYNYGFLKDTLSPDGDALDVFVLGDTPIVPGAAVKIDVLGALRCKDDGIQDDKIIAKISGDVVSAPSGVGLIIKYLSTYKDNFVVEASLGKDEALELIYRATLDTRSQAW